MKTKLNLSLIFLLFAFNCQTLLSFDTSAKNALLMDFDTNQVLFSKHADKKIYPASMSKLMTLYILFDSLDKGIVSLEDTFSVSRNAYQKEGSTIYAELETEISVENLIKGIVVSSGNDACIALAEGIAGTEEEFAIMMTEKAKEIGMENTNFSNSSGINDPYNYSTVKDILIMSNYLIKNYPDYYEYFKEKDFTWDRTGGDPITQGNRNPLLAARPGILASIVASPGLMAVTVPSWDTFKFSDPFATFQVGRNFEPLSYLDKL